jgi:superfamily II DNA or RNA helicase
VVLPGIEEQILMVRPLGGTEDEVTGIYLPIETVEPAQFALPDPSLLGDYRSCKLLRDAIRLGFRSSAGPFRSFARIAVDPRPYQLVPLLMALKMDPIRLMIADDVGIGKTIEAVLIARELMDRGEICRMAVLCPPHLAEQWQEELSTKFHIAAVRVLSSTANQLEKHLGIGQSLFDANPFTVVSTDFIKSDRHRNEFLRTCPELVIVDEAHTCAFGYEGRGRRQQRHKLLLDLTENKDRHVILVTATPHSGKEEEFRSLLKILDRDFQGLPADITGKENEHHRRHLAMHFVQRRRGDIRHFLGSNTPFPERDPLEASYTLSGDYKKLLTRALRYASEIVETDGGREHYRRVRWWSALALLRSIASSPAAAAATLRSRASVADTESEEDADEIGKRMVLDQESDGADEIVDFAPGADIEDPDVAEAKNRRRLLEMAKAADELYGEKDNKVLKATLLIKDLLGEGHNPIVFCRFIPTAEYVADHLRKHLSGAVEVICITGLLPPTEREERIRQIDVSRKCVLVATDCLSEGINLQTWFDAVFHYDLCWNPTRHEQREGRVDRYGQPRPKVRALTYYGTDNQIDGLVLDVLIRKHKTIRSSLGVTVPVPVDTNAVIEALYQGLLLRGKDNQDQLSFAFAEPTKRDLHEKWDNAKAREEKRSKTMYAQETIKTEDVAAELKAAQEAIGSGVDVEAFTKEAFRACKAVVSDGRDVNFDLSESPRVLKEAVDKVRFKARFELPVDGDVLHLNRTHPIVEGLASYVLDTALDPILESPARRCGVIRTQAVSRRTTVLLLRLRYHIVKIFMGQETPLLAEDCLSVAFAGTPENPEWLEDGIAEGLLDVRPDGNIGADQAKVFIEKVIAGFEGLRPRLEKVAILRGEELLDAHRRVRSASKQTGVTYRVEPHLPPDVMGVYIYLPVAGGAA